MAELRLETARLALVVPELVSMHDKALVGHVVPVLAIADVLQRRHIDPVEVAALGRVRGDWT